MRSLRHPGPPAAERVRAVPCRAHRLSLTLPAGSSVNEAVTGALAEAGFVSGFARLDGRSIRFLGCDTPESASPYFHGDQEPWAGRATAFVERVEIVLFV